LTRGRPVDYILKEGSEAQRDQVISFWIEGMKIEAA
jgi:hypothetical protein